MNKVMQKSRFPFAVRLIGFSEHEADLFVAYFELEQDQNGKGLAYFCLSEDSLQDPDLFIVNGDEMKALATLADLSPGNVRPALVISIPALPLSYPCLERPIVWPVLFQELDNLIERRADAISRLPASELVVIPERRRRERVDIDLTDPLVYKGMRGNPPRGGVLLIDKNSSFCDQLGAILSRFHIKVNWVDSEASALEYCMREPVGVVLINTSTPHLDPYRLCESVKRRAIASKTAVIFLVGKPFEYNASKGRAAGSDGLLNKPVSGTHLITALKKFLPFSR